MRGGSSGGEEGAGCVGGRVREQALGFAGITCKADDASPGGLSSGSKAAGSGMHPRHRGGGGRARARARARRWSMVGVVLVLVLLAEDARGRRRREEEKVRGAANGEQVRARAHGPGYRAFLRPDPPGRRRHHSDPNGLLLSWSPSSSRPRPPQHPLGRHRHHDHGCLPTFLYLPGAHDRGLSPRVRSDEIGPGLNYSRRVDAGGQFVLDG